MFALGIPADGDLRSDHDNQHDPWWQHGFIYQIYPRSFKDSNGDGIGDLRGITSQLAYLKWLGVEAVWISPFYPSPIVDFGYDVSHYTDVDPIFGDLAMFDELIQQAHRQGLKVIIDFVPNHTSDKHPWFLASRSSRQDPKRDWYMWADPKPDGSLPNNWLSVMGGSAWEWDAAHFILKDPHLRDNPPNSSQKRVLHKPMGDYDLQLHVYDKGHPDVHGIYRAVRSLLESYSGEHPRVAIGETHILDWKEWAGYYGANLDEMHMPFNFGLVSAAWKAQAIRQSVDALEAHLPPGAWPNYVLGNHDEPRIVNRVGPVQARLAMLLLTLRGTPTLYYGDEIGMHDGEIAAERVYDPMEKNRPGLGLGCDPARTPMQWDSSPNAGFCPPGTEPWLPLPTDSQQINVAVEREDPHSLLTLTRRLIELRRSTLALTTGGYRPIEPVPDGCFVYLRQVSSQRYLIALNFSGREQTLKLSEMGHGRLVLSTYLDREEPIDLALLQMTSSGACTRSNRSPEAFLEAIIM